MSISENDRLSLRQALTRVLESDHLAAVAMEAMPPLDYNQLATKTDLDVLGRELRAEINQVRSELRGEMAELRGEMAELRAELRGEMAELRAELRGEMAELRGEMAELRAELRGEMTSNLRMMLAGQLTTMMMLGAWITAVT